MLVKKPDPTLTSRHRGRPALPEEERKQARNLSVSPAAWQGLEAQLSALQIKTASELLEKIGTHQIQLLLQDPSPLADVPIYRRLKSLIGEPVAVFWSILAFVVRLQRQLNLALNDELDEAYVVTMQACTIAFYIGYTHPDVLINNPSALLRWLCYRIMLARKEACGQTGKPELTAQEQVDPQTIDRHLCRIGNAFHVLEMAARSPDYEALKMKVLDGLTIKQISRVFKLQDLEVSKAEVSFMIKKGLANFRLLYVDATDLPLQLPKAWKTTPTVWEDACCYIKLALQKQMMDVESQQAMETILLKTSQDSCLDFWLNEVDYALGSQNTEIWSRIAETLEERLIGKKTEIDRELAFCRTREQMRQILQTYASREAGTNLPIKLLLSETT